MAKISELTPASTVESADLLLMTRGAVSLQSSIENLFSNVPVSVKVLEPAETLVASGSISPSIEVTKIKALTTPAAYTLAAGTHGSTKVIVCNAVEATPEAVVTVTGGIGFTTVTFNSLGGSVILKCIDAQWYIVGSNSVVIA